VLRPYIPSAFLLTSFFILLSFPAFTWGFFAHKKINQLAVFTLPPEMLSFYKEHIDYLAVHSTDADKRRHAVKGEAERHYIDLDHYGAEPFDSIPKKWKEAVTKFSEDTLRAYGIVPWQIERMVFDLTDAFKEMNVDRILYVSANLGHYIGDAHVPLHTTENYNGQLTNQVGIHGFWESRLPELFSEKWNFFTGRSRYIDDPNQEIWKIIKESFTAKDSVLQIEARLSTEWSTDKKYGHEGNKKVYSAEFSEAYNKKLNGMVERRMRGAISAIGSFWYTAWVNGGQPDLKKLMSKDMADSLKATPKTVETGGKRAKGHDDE
jgi:hypothetical protein